MIRFLFDAWQLYNQFNSTKDQSGTKQKAGLLAALYAAICIIIYSILSNRIDHTTAITTSIYLFIIGELLIGILLYRQLKSTSKPLIVQSAQLVKNLVPSTLTGKQKIALVGTALLLLLIVLPKHDNRNKS